MARKDPPGTIYLGSGIEIEGWINKERELVHVKIVRRTATGKKYGVVVSCTIELLPQVPEGAEYPRGRIRKMGR